jgi:hypothetical protein
MKLYHIDQGWRGAVTVAAETREEALEKLRGFNWLHLSEQTREIDLEEYEITPDLQIISVGDAL